MLGAFNGRQGESRLDGNTPLDVAIKYKRTEIIDLLCKHGGKTA